MHPDSRGGNPKGRAQPARFRPALLVA